MEKTQCCTCLKPKATLECGICKEAVCKNCAQFLDVETFSFMGTVPEALSHGTFCHACYEAKVASEVAEFNEIMEQAKDIHFYEIDQGKETRFFNRKEKPLKVENCRDRDEVLMKLAFFTAKKGHNCLLDVDVVSTKIKSGTYQTHNWTGSGIPSTVGEARLNRKDRARSPSRR